MSITDLKNSLKDAQTNIVLKNYTSMKVGGAAELFYKAKTQDELKNAVSLAWKYQVPVLVLGQGTNLIVSDKGFPGLVVLNLSQNLVVGTREAIVDSGILLEFLIRQLLERDLGGLEFLAGIPGTLGGAIYGNAGAFGRSIADICIAVTILDVDQKVRSLNKSQLKFGYRTSIFKEQEHSLLQERKPILLGATLKVTPSKKEVIKRIISNFLKIRQKRQVKNSSCGCFFKNVLEKDYPELSSKAKLAAIDGKISVGAILERVGAKELRVGGIRVAAEHANFIINTGGGTADEVKELAEILKKKVYSKFGVKLVEEVEYIGEFQKPKRRGLLKIFS